MSDVYSVDVTVRAPVNRTEVADRVADAITEIFPGATVERRPGEVVAETHSLAHLAERLREQAILDTARAQFLENRTDGGFGFALKKQAALEGVVTFSVGNPDELGEIEVDVAVREPDVEALVDRIAPPTEDGVPVDPEDR